MLQKVVSLLFCIGVILGSISAAAAENTGTIGILLEQEGEVTLYRVGDLTQTGFRLSESYGGETLTFDALISPELSALLAQEAAEGTVCQSQNGLVTCSGLEPGIYLLVQTACSRESYPFSPFLVTIPWEGDQWELQVEPKALEQPEPPKTGEEGIYLAMGLMLLSGTGLLVCTGKQRKPG